jgi:hypothetical protein
LWFGPPFPGAVHQLDQAFDFLARCIAIFNIAGPDFVGVEDDVVSALLPGERIGRAVIDNSPQVALR